MSVGLKRFPQMVCGHTHTLHSRTHTHITHISHTRTSHTLHARTRTRTHTTRTHAHYRRAHTHHTLHARTHTCTHYTHAHYRRTHTLHAQTVFLSHAEGLPDWDSKPIFGYKEDTSSSETSGLYPICYGVISQKTGS